jgi:hypothetical protein
MSKHLFSFTPFCKALTLLTILALTSLACTMEEAQQKLQGLRSAPTATLEENAQENEQATATATITATVEEYQGFGATHTRTPRATYSPTPNATETSTATPEPVGEPITASNAASVQLLRTIDAHLTRQVTGLAISPDSRTLASGSAEPLVKTWDAQSGELFSEAPVGFDTLAVAFRQRRRQTAADDRHRPERDRFRAAGRFGIGHGLRP